LPTRSRDISIDDIAAIQALTASEPDRAKVYKAVERVAAETVGFVFLTTLRYNEKEACVQRLHSSNEQAYPVGGSKPLSKITASHQALDSGEVFLAPDRAAVKAAFFDHELIFSLGSTAILNAPIRMGGRRLGTLNFCGEEGTYGAAEVRNAKLLAGLLVPCLLLETAG
jgi:hypothetical protein